MKYAEISFTYYVISVATPPPLRFVNTFKCIKKSKKIDLVPGKSEKKVKYYTKIYQITFQSDY